MTTAQLIIPALLYILYLVSIFDIIKSVSKQKINFYHFGPNIFGNWLVVTLLTYMLYTVLATSHNRYEQLQQKCPQYEKIEAYQLKK